MTPIGQRRTRVTFQRLKSGLTQDAAGHINEKTESNWETYCERQAKVDYSGGSESVVGDQVVAVTNWVLTVPRDSKTQAADMRMRVRWTNGSVTHTCGITEPPFDANQGNREVMVKCAEVRR
jgi:hypothetical protein